MSIINLKEQNTSEISVDETNNPQYLYIVVSQTGSIVSKCIKMITRKKYNHVSVSLDKSLTEMYSFGRVRPYNPVYGGFVMESLKFGTFARFTKTEGVVICIEITQKQKEQIQNQLDVMYKRRKLFHYNYIGLFLAAFHIHYKNKNHYYCSEFVSDLLIKNNVVDEHKLTGIVHPCRFLKLEEINIIYSGKLQQYYCS